MGQMFGSLRPSEITLVNQSQIEGLESQQVLARDLLVLSGFMSASDATELVTGLSAEKYARLKQHLQTHGILKEDIERLLAQPI